MLVFTPQQTSKSHQCHPVDVVHETKKVARSGCRVQRQYDPVINARLPTQRSDKVDLEHVSAFSKLIPRTLSGFPVGIKHELDQVSESSESDEVASPLKLRLDFGDMNVSVHTGKLDEGARGRLDRSVAGMDPPRILVMEAIWQ